MLKISSILENPDPQSKIISFLAIIFSVIWIPITNFKDFGLYSLLIPAISFLLKITLGQILKKMCILISFVLFVAVFMPFVKEGFVCWSRKLGYWKLEIAYEGIWTFLDIVVKLNLFLFLFISASSKTFPDFLKELELLRLPRFLIKPMSFTHRYFIVLVDKTTRLLYNKYLRFYDSPYRQQLQAPGYMTGMLSLCSFEQTEKIDNATILSGFHGEIPSAKDFRISSLDFLFIAGIIVSLLCIVSGFVYKIEYMKAENVHL